MIGNVYHYIHHNRNIGVMIELRTQTDFALRSECVNALSIEICLQVAATKIDDIDELLQSKYIKDDSLTIKELMDLTKLEIKEGLRLTKVKLIDSTQSADNPYSNLK